MKRQIEVVLSPEEATNDQLLKATAAKLLFIKLEDITGIHLLKRSIDARSRNVKVRQLVEVYWGETAPVFTQPEFKPQNISNKPPAIIIGSGPAGLFAALKLIELGYKPVIFE